MKDCTLYFKLTLEFTFLIVGLCCVYVGRPTISDYTPCQLCEVLICCIAGLGGTCVNVGCIPKKLMHQAAILGKFTLKHTFLDTLTSTNKITLLIPPTVDKKTLATLDPYDV